MIQCCLEFNYCKYYSLSLGVNGVQRLSIGGGHHWWGQTNVSEFWKPHVSFFLEARTQIMALAHRGPNDSNTNFWKAEKLCILDFQFVWCRKILSLKIYDFRFGTYFRGRDLWTGIGRAGLRVSIKFNIRWMYSKASGGDRRSDHPPLWMPIIWPSGMEGICINSVLMDSERLYCFWE